MWYEIIGVTLGFLGSVIFSAGLIKSKEQIRDENSAYWDSNPFTLEAELSSRPYYIVAFALIIAGFAVSLGGMLGTLLDDKSALTPFLIALSTTLLGYIFAIFFYIHQANEHKKRQIKRLRKVFLSALKTYSADMQGIVGQPNESDLFTANFTTYQQDLHRKAEAIGEMNNSSEVEIARRLGSLRSARSYHRRVQEYLDNQPRNL